MAGDDAGLLVADAAAAHGDAQLGQAVEAALEGDALADGPLGEAEPLRAIMAEAEELHVAPEAALEQQHGEVAEEVVPAGAKIAEAAQVGVETDEVHGRPSLGQATARHRALTRRRLLRQRRRIELGEEGPALVLLLEPGLERLPLRGGAHGRDQVLDAAEGRSGLGRGRVGAEVLLADGLEALPGGAPGGSSFPAMARASPSFSRATGSSMSPTRSQGSSSSSAPSPTTARTSAARARTVSTRAFSTQAASSAPRARATMVSAFRGLTAPEQTASRSSRSPTRSVARPAPTARSSAPRPRATRTSRPSRRKAASSRSSHLRSLSGVGSSVQATLESAWSSASAANESGACMHSTDSTVRQD